VFSLLQLQPMGAFAEFERNILRKRRAESIAKAKARGVYRGRKKKVDDRKIVDLNQQGKRVSEIAAALGVSRMTVYRALDRARCSCGCATAQIATFAA